MHTPPADVSCLPAARSTRGSGLRPVWVLSLALLGAVCSASAVAHSVGGKTDEDLDLARRVQAALLVDRAFQAANVDLVVQASQGRVNLSGWLSYVGNDPRARMIALSVPGVTAVTSQFNSWASGADPRWTAR
jgi:BON domain